MTKASIFRFLAKTVATLFVPALFTAIMVLALSASFGVAVVILISLIIVQTLLSEKFSFFSWEEYSSLSFDPERYLPSDIMSKAMNILFNLTKLMMLFAFMSVVMNKFDFPNPFGSIGYAISASLTFILVLFYLLKRGRDSYENLRGILALITTIAIGIFTYLYFGTQLIWFAVLFQFVLGFIFLACFDIEQKFKLEKYSFSTVAVIILVLTATVSTIIQFWSNICDLMIAAWASVLKASLYQFIFGIDLYILILVPLGIFLTIYLTIRFLRRRQARKIAYAKFLQEEAEKQERKEKEETEKRREKQAEEQRISDTKADIIAIIAQAQSENITNKQFAYLAKNRNYLELELPIKSLSNISLKDAFIISKIKKHIIWHNSMEEVLIFINYLYSRSYKDEELEQLVKLLKDLYDFLVQYHDYVGYDNFNQMVEKIIKSIPTKLYWCLDK